MPQVATHGTWTSPIAAATVAGAGLRLSGVAADGDDVYWLEGRPAEGGRIVLVRRGADGATAEVTPHGINVRSRVHEYGGGAYAVAGGVVYCSHMGDGRVYRLAPGAGVEPLTAEGAFRYADFAIDPVRGGIVCVREDHTGGGEPVNALVRITGAQPHGEVVAAGHDFYSTPRFSPDGGRLCWLAWRHPQMPWDGTTVWVATVDDDGCLHEPQLIAGGERESIYQPGWGVDGALYFVSDRDGWWKLYRAGRDGARPVVRNAPADAEFGRPQWVFGSASWAPIDPDRLVASCTRGGRWRLATVHVPSGLLTEIAPVLVPHEWVAATPRHALCVAGSLTEPDAVVRVDLDTSHVEVLRSASPVVVDVGYLSTPEPIAVPTDDGVDAHAFFYAPQNRDFVGPRNERPPLIVVSHGGPTTAARPTLDLAVQFWTSRGFAVADVDYRGSSGYGRPYRQLLNGRWGVADVEDIIGAARVLVTQGRVDVRRLVARGGSAGGYTTLAALTFHPGVFAAGASYYGISDVEVLARDTHKFEARYLDTLIGPYPEMRAVYEARSPIHFAGRLTCALILFQGLDDKVVPPNQSQMMADAVRAKGLPVEYHAFAGEQHGFRRADTIARALEAELAFYLRVLSGGPDALR